jgi:hypothetical protein
MKRLVLPVIVAVHLLLVAGSSGKGDGPAPCKNDDAAIKEQAEEYVRIELKGLLIQWFDKPAIQLGDTWGGTYKLDLRKAPKEYQGEGWRKLAGETAIVNCTFRENL